MSGSLAAVLGPAALRFFFPMRVVGGGGGSYLGLSFYNVTGMLESAQDMGSFTTYLLIFIVTSIATWATAHVRLLVTLYDGWSVIVIRLAGR